MSADAQKLPAGTVVDYGWEVGSTASIDLKNVEQFLSSLIDALGLVVLESVSGRYGYWEREFKVVTQAQAAQMHAEYQRAMGGAR
jgi:hypothetical protein